MNKGKTIVIIINKKTMHYNSTRYFTMPIYIIGRMRVDEARVVQTRALVWPETLMQSHRFLCDLIEFEPAHIFHESRRDLDDSRSRLARVGDSR